MDTVKISTPDGGIPPVPHPIEGEHYTVVQGTPVAGDLVRTREGKSEAFFRKGPDILPPVASLTEGRDLTWDEFLDVGMATDALKTNAILGNLHVVKEYGRKYVDKAGIQFADASTPGTRLKTLMDTAKAADLIDDTFLENFIAAWIQLYPKMVPQD